MKVGRRTWLTLLSLAVLACVVVLAWPRDKEPVYDGRKLSEWLRLGTLKPADQRTRDAVRAIGTNALPYLLHAITYEPSPVRRKLVAAEIRFPKTARFLHPLQRIVDGSGGMRAIEAGFGFEVLGAEAAAAVAELSGLANGTNSVIANRAMGALANIGEPGIPSLVAILTNTNHAYRGSAAYYVGRLRRLGPGAKPAVPALLQCVGGRDRVLAEASLESLGTLALEPAVCVPVLTNQLQNADFSLRITAVRSLGMFRGQAHPAVPALEALLSDSNLIIREEATNALHSIDPERFKKSVFE